MFGPPVQLLAKMAACGWSHLVEHRVTCKQPIACISTFILSGVGFFDRVLHILICSSAPVKCFKLSSIVLHFGSFNRPSSAWRWNVAYWLSLLESFCQLRSLLTRYIVMFCALAVSLITRWSHWVLSACLHVFTKFWYVICYLVPTAFAVQIGNFLSYIYCLPTVIFVILFPLHMCDFRDGFSRFLPL